MDPAAVNMNPETLCQLARLRSLYDFQFSGKAEYAAALAEVNKELGRDSRTPSGTSSPAAENEWASAFFDLFSEVGETAFNRAVRKVCSRPSFPRPTIVIGPVIGKVTDTTARVMVECSQDAKVSIRLTSNSNNSQYVGARKLQLRRGVASVATFDDLNPYTNYIVSIKGAEMLVEKSSFWTLPKGGYRVSETGVPPRFAVASCNSIKTTYQSSPEHPLNLWTNLADRFDNGEKIDYMFHLGDNVYLDIDWHLIEKGKTPINGNLCKWGMARKWLESVPPSMWNKFADEVEDLFRSIYRETWGYLPQRKVLANVPNLMIFDDHDIRDDWGDRDDDKKLSEESILNGNLDAFMGKIAYRVLQEYQCQLNADWVEQPIRDFHHHAFGDVGVLFLDQRACKTFHWKDEDVDSPMLGDDQWRSIKDALFKHDGTFAKCRALFVLSPQPVAYVSPTATVIGGKVVDDLLGQWSAPNHVAEVPRFMNSLLRWQSHNSERTILLIGGDVHEGGWTDIRNTEGQSIRQLTTSAIANSMTHDHEALAVVLTRDMGGAMDMFKLAGGWSFLHYDWTNKNNYALLDTIANSDNQVAITGRLIASNGKAIKERKVHSTRDLDAGQAQRIAELGRKVAYHGKGTLMAKWEACMKCIKSPQ